MAEGFSYCLGFGVDLKFLVDVFDVTADGVETNSKLGTKTQIHREFFVLFVSLWFSSPHSVIAYKKIGSQSSHEHVRSKRHFQNYQCALTLTGDYVEHAANLHCPLLHALKPVSIIY